MTSDKIDIVTRLKTPSNTDAVMKSWDGIRASLLAGVMGTLPRDIFESILDCIDEEREEAAQEIERLRALVASANPAQGHLSRLA